MVDLQALNLALVHQTHQTETPFMLASRVPHGVKKTSLDAFNGYHGFKLHEEDAHYTTFITAHGSYRYLRSPEDYLAAGDAYTHKHDMITDRLVKNGDKKFVKCVDDALLWDCDLKEAFENLYVYISHCGKHGVGYICHCGKHVGNLSKYHLAAELDLNAGR